MGKGKRFCEKSRYIYFRWFSSDLGFNLYGPNGFDVKLTKVLCIYWEKFCSYHCSFRFWNLAGRSNIDTRLLAKEVIISSMAILYSSNENGLVNVIQHQFTPISAYAFMIFILLYVPCISTVATIRKETCSWKWTLIAVIYPVLTAYILTLIFYQFSHLFT